MNIYQFAKIFQGIPVFSTLDIEKRFPGFERENLLNWQKKGILIRIRNGWYSFASEIKTLEQAYYTANKIYTPSYVSLESALAYYHWIPEGVFTITSISTLKTSTFDTPVGRFRYSNIKPGLFFGYKLLSVNGHGVKMAEPEKALLDFLYFHPEVREDADLEAYRLNLPQLRSDLNREKLMAYASLFKNIALSKRLLLLTNMLDHAEPI